MNRYAAQAQAHWARLYPDRLANLDDPQTYFTSLGEDVAMTIEHVTAQLAGTAPAGETYLQRVRRLATARRNAESQVIREMVLQADSPQP